MAINFPDSPATNDTFTSGNVTWQWDGSSWNVLPKVIAHAVTHQSGGSDALTLAQSQVTNLTTDLSTLTNAVNGKASLSGATFTGSISYAIPDIPNAANLNDYTTTGVYHQDSNAEAGTGSNYPATWAGLLEVFSGGNANFIYQRYTTYEDFPMTWYRNRYNGAWTAWMPVGQSLFWNTSSSTTIGNAYWGGTIRLTGTTARTFTFTSGMPPGTRVDVIQDGTGQITIAGSGVTIKSKKGTAPKLNGQYAAATVMAYSTTEYYVIGDLA
jgi:hypothetical protein